MHICLIDDDPRLLSTLQRGFHESGHTCEVFRDANLGLERLMDRDLPQHDLLLLDIMMPEVDGWSVLEQVRASGHRTPTIFLTARQEVEDRVHGLELGADDYVIKPFAFSELLARIQAVLRRAGYQAPVPLGELLLHRNKPLLEGRERSIELSPREHGFLDLLASHPDRIYSRAELLRHVWGLDFDPGTNVVHVLVARLRKKLGPRDADLIETVVGEGYRISRQRGS